MRIPAGIVWIVVACASCLAALPACSEAESDARPSKSIPSGANRDRAVGARPQQPAARALPLFDASLARPPRTWLPGRVAKPPAWSDAWRARLDPRRDGYPAEALCARLEDELARALSAALGPHGDAAALRGLGSADLTLPFEFVPAARTTLLADDGVRAEEATEFATAADVDAALAGWRALFANLGDVRCEVAIETWTQRTNGRIGAQIVVRSSARGATSAQATLALDTEWVTVEGSARLARAAPRSVTTVTATTPLFVDGTRGALAAEPWFANDVLLGTNARHSRRDRLGLDPFLGMHGIAVGDVNGDGLDDVYVCQSSGIPNRLLIHLPDGTARDAAVPAGVAFLDGSSCAFFADLDGDGDEDLGIATGDVLLLAWNDGHGRFPEGSALRAPDGSEIYSVAAADVDLDGDLDLYACRYVEGGVMGGAPAPYHDAHNGAKNVFWRNEGDRRFRECTAEVGLDAGNDRFSLAAVFDDFDDDGDADLYVTNDFGRNNLYANEGGHFVDVAPRSDAEDVAASMGAAVGDVDLDGALDIYVTNMESAAGSRIARNERFLAARPAERPAYVRHARGNSLLAGRADLHFDGALEESGARRGCWAWGSVFSDWNADGLPDVFVPNGFLTGSRSEDLESYFWRVLVASTPAAPPPTEEYLRSWQFFRQLTMVEGYSWSGHQRDDAYLNVGGRRFVDASRALGIDFPEDGRCAVRCDWDGDLREDLWIGSRTAPCVRLLLANDARVGRSVAFELTGMRTNRQGIGATVFVEAGGRTLRGAARIGDGYLSSSSKRILVGLGDAASIAAVRVRWPGGEVESFSGVRPGAVWRLVEGSGRAEERVLHRARPTTEATPWNPVAGAGFGRIVLDDRLPIGPFEWTTPEGGTRRVDEFTGSALLVGIGRVGDPETEQLAASLAAPFASAGSGIATSLIALPETGQEAAGRGWLDEHAPGGRGGMLDARAAQVLEVLLIEVLGPFEKLPLPLVLMVDRGGDLVLVRCGPTGGEALWSDARAVAELQPGARGTESLVGGGRWVRGPERALGPMGDVFERLGRADWAAWFRQRALARPGR